MEKHKSVKNYNIQVYVMFETYWDFIKDQHASLKG